MSVDGYLGPKRGELRLKQGDVLGEGAVMEGRASVEAAREEAARRAARAGTRYRSVAEYDAVLRSHCGLDRER